MPTDDETGARERIIALAKTCAIHEPHTRPTPWLIRACCKVVLRRFAGEDFVFTVRLNGRLDAVYIVAVDGIFIEPTVWAHLVAEGIPCEDVEGQDEET